MSSALQPLGGLLPARIASLEARAREALSLTEQVRALLPDQEKNHLLSASCREDTLSVTMDSAAWCPRLRYSAEAFLAELKSRGGPECARLKVRVGARAKAP